MEYVKPVYWTLTSCKKSEKIMRQTQENGVKDVGTYAPSEEESWIHGTVWQNRVL